MAPVAPTMPANQFLPAGLPGDYQLRVINFEYEPGIFYPVSIKTTVAQWHEDVSRVHRSPPFSTVAARDLLTDFCHECAFIVAKLMPSGRHAPFVLPPPVFFFKNRGGATVVDFARA